MLLCLVGFTKNNRSVMATGRAVNDLLTAYDAVQFTKLHKLN